MRSVCAVVHGDLDTAIRHPGIRTQEFAGVIVRNTTGTGGLVPIFEARVDSPYAIRVAFAAPVGIATDETS
jgi:hypothetical protein